MSQFCQAASLLGNAIHLTGQICYDLDGPDAAQRPQQFAADFAVTRYQASGELDRSFGDNGIVPLTSDLNQSHAIAAQGDTIWVGGNTVQQ
ncbi:hypothetical protein IQ241_18360 [Romeria aff. gracilis LEGE 07310]|uniref:Uncharacterized protein n=1 Tax=Vasconcelosia minhoensis LEGE 07310 TaxID=915328 RepID=A0A8J7DMR7_9CYAN|nr:hypothetical protein [Romeria gracilis]MBE9079236.1 hypothetical protein [Romeria aff. gracilis LEGE 07310]